MILYQKMFPDVFEVRISVLPSLEMMNLVCLLKDRKHCGIEIFNLESVGGKKRKCCLITSLLCLSYYRFKSILTQVFKTLDCLENDK